MLAVRGERFRAYLPFHATAPVESGRGCLTVITANDGGFREGGFYVLDSVGKLVDYSRDYPGASNPQAAGRDRVAIVSISGEGSGYYATVLTVLCSFGTSYWVECLSTPLDQNVTSYSDSVVDIWTRTATFVVTDSTIQTVRSGHWERHTRSVPDRVVAERALPIDTVRLRLP